VFVADLRLRPLRDAACESTRIGDGRRLLRAVVRSGDLFWLLAAGIAFLAL